MTKGMTIHRTAAMARVFRRGEWLLSLGVLSVLVLSTTGCATHYPPIPKPEPLQKPVDTQTAIDALVAHPKPAPVLPSPNKPLTGVVTRKALAEWLIAHTGGYPKLVATVPAFQDVSNPAFATVVKSTAWGKAFLSKSTMATAQQAKFMPGQAVNREQFCWLMLILAGHAEEISAKPTAQLDSFAPPNGKPFTQCLDILQLSPQSRPAVAWAYKEQLLEKAFGLTSDRLVDEGLHPGQAVQWQEIEASLIFVLTQTDQYHLANKQANAQSSAQSTAQTEMPHKSPNNTSAKPVKELSPKNLPTKSIPTPH
jgi:hypothetical protein